MKEEVDVCFFFPLLSSLSAFRSFALHIYHRSLLNIPPSSVTSPFLPLHVAKSPSLAMHPAVALALISLLPSIPSVP